MSNIDCRGRSKELNKEKLRFLVVVVVVDALSARARGGDGYPRAGVHDDCFQAAKILYKF